MSRLSRVLCLAAALLCAPSLRAAEQAPDWVQIFEEASHVTDWKDLLADTASGSVSAASLLGISGESVTPVENLRDVVLGLQGLGSGGDRGTLALSVTPGRTGIAPVPYASYRRSALARLWAATTFAYAQGDADIEEKSFARRALSVETSLVLHEGDDELVIIGDTLKNPRGTECDVDQLDDVQAARKVYEQAREAQQHEADLAMAKAIAQGHYPPDTEPQPVTVVMQENALSQAKQAHYKACFDQALKRVRWNRSRLALMYGTGWIKPASGGGRQEGLGQTLVVSLNYGFESLPSLRERLGLMLTYRQTWAEPVLSSLAAGTPGRKSSALLIGQLAGGNSRIRALAQFSNARSRDITASQRAFKEAAGLDLRVLEGLWLNLRVGRQRAVGGDSNETGSLLSLSYSPSALLK